MATKYYLYYVEGEDEKKVVDTLKKDMKLIRPGVSQVFNVVENELTNARLMTIKENTTVVLMYDENHEADVWYIHIPSKLQRKQRCLTDLIESGFLICETGDDVMKEIKFVTGRGR